jgi:DNA-binding NtrC family response regulator
VLGRHTWPGNVRELDNVIGHACMIVLGDTIDVEDLPQYLRMGSHPDLASSHLPGSDATQTVDSLEANERMVVANALNERKEISRKPPGC